AQARALRDLAVLLELDLDLAAGEGLAGPITVGPDFGRTQARLVRVALVRLHLVRLSQQQVHAPATRRRARLRADPDLPIDFRARRVVAGLELVLRRVEVRIAAGPEDLLELQAVRLVLKVAEG